MWNARRIGAVLVALFLVGVGLVLADDWPQWRGANRDGKASGFTVPETWPKALTRKWSVPVGSGDATPALVGEKLYVFARQGAEEVTLCLDAADGKELWRDTYAARAVTGAAARHPGPRGSPAVADGKVVTLGAGGILSCLDAATGKLLWRKDEFPNSAPRFFTGLSPLIADGLVIAHLGSEQKGALMAFDLATGDVKWKWDAEGPAYGSPALLTAGGTKQVVTLTAKSIVGVALADGKLLWQRPFPVSGMAYNAATPIVDGDMVIYTGQGRGTKAVKVEKKDDGFTATELWANPDLGVKFNTPVLRDGMLIGLSDKGNLFCVSAKDGKAVWTDTTRRGDFGAIVDVGPVLLVLPMNSELLVVKPGDKYEEVAKIKVADKGTYAHPVVAGKRIFIKDEGSLTLWTIE